MDVAQMFLWEKPTKKLFNIEPDGWKGRRICGIDGNVIECEQYKTTIDGQETDLGYVGK